MRLNAKNIRNRQEFIASIILLSSIIIITTAVLVKQSSYKMSSFGMISTEKGQNAGVSFGGVKIELLSPGDFKPLLSGERYNRDTLYEKINGKATLYLESGFRELFSQRFVSVNNSNFWIELFIYDMGDFRNAYSVYGQQKRDDAEDIPKTDMAYRTSNAAFLVHGAYYVEILGSAKSAVLSKAILEMCSKIKSDLKTNGAPAEKKISLIDKKYMAPGTDKLNLNSAFGYGAFKNVFTARYKYKDSTATVFLSDMKSPPEAVGIADGYYRFLIENGGELKKRDTVTGMKFVSLYGSFEAVTSCGSHVAGVHEADTLKDAENIAQIVFDKVCGKK
jgi:hypothetical protein